MTYTKFLVFISIIILLSGAYLYIYKGDKSLAADSSSLSSSLDNSSNVSKASIDNQISIDTAFLSSLSSLTKIKIDTSLFNSKSFNSLKDNNITLESVVPGRSNPFSPVELPVLNSTENSSIKTIVP